jgi:predicted nucleic acid-binding protein
MTTLVIDACVSLKWVFNDEEAIAQATQLRDQGIAGHFEFIAPSLWIYEVINGLVVALRRGRIAEQECYQAATAIQSIGVKLIDPPPQKVQGHAIQYGIGAYDAAYVALAEMLNVPLWTGDRRLFNTISARTSQIKWIGDYPL